MPSPLHDAINQMFRDRPELALELLRDLKGIDMPQTPLVRVESNDFNDRPSKDRRPDTVITVGPPQAPEHAIIVEVQQKKDAAKRAQLPRYAANLWLLLDCPVTVLCICTNADAAAWYEEPIRTKLDGYEFRAVVIGPDQIPMITDAKEAAAHPGLAALAVMAHGRHRKVAEAFVAGLKHLPRDHALQYHEYAHSMSTPAIRRVLEEIMAATKWIVSTPFAREHFGRGKEEGRKEGRLEVREEAREEARAELAEALTQMVARILLERGIEVSAEEWVRINEYAKQSQNNQWTHRAFTATSVDDLFN